jgi:hypothetical protein
MRVSAEIKIGDRRVIEYLLSPVMQAVRRRGRTDEHTYLSAERIKSMG